MTDTPKPTVALFVTCLADLFRPSVAFSTVELLEQAGCEVVVPGQQTCCGQPGYNSGAIAETRPVAQRAIEVFADYPHVVAPSGSCAGMIREHYPKLFEEFPDWRARALELAGRTWEITRFLEEVMNFEPAPCEEIAGRRVTYHDSCAGLRELGIKQQPRQLLAAAGVEVTEMPYTEVCCGFGGTFCAKMPELSQKMVDDKLDNAASVEAEILLGGDLGCLLNIAGRARRRALPLEVRHVTEVLAGQLRQPAIGEADS
jgi:L-lactate dehydrogenase complex protein LldE